MRIDYISSSFISSRFANSIHVMKMCDALSSIGHSVRLFARNGGENTDSDYNFYGVDSNFEIVKTNYGSLGPISHLKEAFQIKSRLNHRERPDLIFSRNINALSLLIYTGVPIIAEVHELPDYLRGRILATLFRSSAFRGLVVISDFLKREYARIYPNLPTAKIIVAPDAASKPKVDQKLRKELLTRFEKNNRLQVGYVGHLYKGRGIDLILELSQKMSDGFDFHIIGGSEAELNTWRTATTGLHNLHFHGFVAPALTDTYRDAMDILIAPYQRKVSIAGLGDSSKWMSPLKIFEYMAAAKPLISSDIPVLHEVLRPNENCLMVPPDEASAWIDSLNSLRDSHLRERLGQNAFKDFTEKFSWEARSKMILSKSQLGSAL